MNDNQRTLPEEEFLPALQLFEAPGMYITKTNKGFTFPGRDFHVHDGYEFMLPLTDMPYVEINMRVINVQKNFVVPIYPWQPHGVSEKMEEVRFLDIFFTEEFFNKVKSGIYGPGSLNFNSAIFQASGHLQIMLRIFMEECSSACEGSNALLTHLSSSIAILLLREISSAGSNYSLNDKHSARVTRVVKYMYENSSSDFSLKNLAEIAGMSQYHFIRVFKSSTGMTPYEFLLDIRINKAKKLLSETSLTITKICNECGINNLSRFTRLFKERTGVTPSFFKSIMR